MSHTPEPDPALDPPATWRESPEQIRKALQAMQAPVNPNAPTTPPAAPAAPPAADRRRARATRPLNAVRGAATGPLPKSPAKPAAKPAPADEAPEPEDEALAFRPVRRAPMALLCILDDGRGTGEWVRLRDDSLIIGRTAGDVCLPHDGLISDEHAELCRRLEQGRHRWYLRDLGSTNGTYVRVHRTVLQHNQELLIGSRRYRFHAGPQGGRAVAHEDDPPNTRPWVDDVAPVDLIPALVELTADGEGQRYLLSRPDNWIGRDARTCSVVLADDPLVNRRHARVYREADGAWNVRNTGSVNGVWLRVKEMAVDQTCRFRLGEQLFFVKVL